MERCSCAHAQIWIVCTGGRFSARFEKRSCVHICMPCVPYCCNTSFFENPFSFDCFKKRPAAQIRAKEGLFCFQAPRPFLAAQMLQKRIWQHSSGCKLLGRVFSVAQWPGSFKKKTNPGNRDGPFCFQSPGPFKTGFDRCAGKRGSRSPGALKKFRKGPSY